MNKQAFLEQLRKGLSGLPAPELEERLTFYSEIIDDRTEEGLSEEEAVAAIGQADAIVAQILEESACAKKKQEETKRKLKLWELLLLVLGSPIWLSLGIAAAAVVLSLYVSLWAVVVSAWAVFVSVAACFLGGLAMGILSVFGSAGVVGIAMIGAGLFCAGLSIFAFFGCRLATKWSIYLPKQFVLWIRKCFAGTEEAQ